MRITGLLISLLILIGCAQTSPLTGGAKDETAPKIDSAKSYPINGQLNFRGREIRLKFNEYIQLNKPNNNILIIPKPETPPDIEAKNKKLSITFQDDLQENTTYSITFNGAIQDITEKNDSVFQYVFSTGDYIDSLKIEGVVKNAFTNKGMKDILVGLYPKSVAANFDSIPYLYEPTYLALTDNRGEFKINYLKDGSYYLFAIGDKNKNLKYDKGEYLSFLENRSFVLHEDIDTFKLHAFREQEDSTYLKDDNFIYPGMLELIFSKEPDTINVTSSMELLKEETERKDSLIYWLSKNPTSGMEFYVNLNHVMDTIKPVYKKIPEDISKVKLKSRNNLKKGMLLPEENLQLNFSEPLLKIEDSLITFLDADSNFIELPEYHSKVREIEFETYGTAAQYIHIDSAAITSLYGRINEEAIDLTFKNEAADYYGNLIVTIDTVFNVPTILQVLNDNQKVVRETDFDTTYTFKEMIPGNYQLRLILDQDNNSEWTGGSLSDMRLAEKVIYNTESFRLKSKWDKEIDWKFTED